MAKFFTTPASQLKRKRHDRQETTADNTQKRGRSSAVSSTKPRSRRRDDSISSGDSDASDPVEEPSEGSSSEDEEKTGAERRLELAERYLQNVQQEVEERPGFDAEEIDRDLIAERLKEDVAETKGRMYRHIAADLDYAGATSTHFRFETDCVTAVAISSPYVYTVSKGTVITKWELPSQPSTVTASSNTKSKHPPPTRRRPTKLLQVKGDRTKRQEKSYMRHTGAILCAATTPDGKFLVTGGADRRLIVWDQSKLEPLRVFEQHRDAVTSISFCNATKQLYSASNDRTIKVWSSDPFAYIETLFGHQDQVIDVAAIGQERCLSAGARDRTIRLWKVAEETQLVFRGGGKASKDRPRERDQHTKHPIGGYAEGSIDKVVAIDNETFVSGSDNGSLSLWSAHKKKPVYTVSLAHGCDPAITRDDENLKGLLPQAPPEPRWITALAVVPFSDFVLSGSWDGQVRAWKVSGDRKKLVPAGTLGRQTLEEPLNDSAMVLSNQDSITTIEPCVRGIINDIDFLEHGSSGITVVAALGKEPRLGRWKSVEGRNGAMIFEIPFKSVE